MMEKRVEYARLLRQGVSVSEACRRLGIDRKTGHWWKNGGARSRGTGSRESSSRPSTSSRPGSSRPATSAPTSASSSPTAPTPDTPHARSLPELGRAVSTVSRELQRNQSPDGAYRPDAAQALMRSRRPRPKTRRLESDVELRGLVQRYLDLQWSPEQVVHELDVTHGHRIAVETVYQALYSPRRVVERDAASVLRTERPHRRPRRRGDERRPRFIVPITVIEERSAEADDRRVAGHWEGDLIVGAFNRSAIGTLVERTSRYTILVHLEGASRSESSATSFTRSSRTFRMCCGGH